MSRVIKTASVDGATSGSAGLSTADVNTLIHAKSGWEYIDTFEFSGQNTHLLIDDSNIFDWDTYSQLRFTGRNIRHISNNQAGFRIKYESANNYWPMAYINHYSNTYNSSTSSNIMYSFTYVQQYANLSFDFTLHYNTSRLSANWNTYMGNTGGYDDHHNWGSGFYGSATSGVGGVQFYNFYTDTANGGDDKIEIFGIRRDTKRT